MNAMAVKTPGARRKSPQLAWAAWLGMVPFLIFGLAFELLPLLTVIRSSLYSKGVLTLDFYRQALDPLFLRSFGNSLKLSATTAGLGGPGTAGGVVDLTAGTYGLVCLRDSPPAAFPAVTSFLVGG